MRLASSSDSAVWPAQNIASRRDRKTPLAHHAEKARCSQHAEARGRRSALRYPWVWITSGYAAASVWIPPGGSELTEQQEARVEPMLEDLLGTRSGEVIELLERFDASHPTGEPHYYLNLLGTHPDHRGRGLGMDLLAKNLTRIDEEGMPAYLESSNPDNNTRYESVGFRPVGEFSTPDRRHTVSTMWREAH